MAVDTYLDVLDELKDLTLKKRAGYSPGEDPFKNFRMSTQFGVDPLKGILVRVMDKLARVSSLIENPANDRLGESLRDNLLDAGNYLLIAVAYNDAEDEKRWSDSLERLAAKTKALREEAGTLTQDEARKMLVGDMEEGRVWSHDIEECEWCRSVMDNVAPEPEATDQTVGSDAWFVSGNFDDYNPAD